MQRRINAELLFLLTFLLFVEGYLLNSILPALSASILAAYLAYHYLIYRGVSGEKPSIERILPKEAVYQKKPVDVSLRIKNKSLPLVFALTEIEPPGITIRGNVFTGFLPPRGEKEFTYTAMPQRKGEAGFDGIWLQLTDSRGLYTLEDKVKLDHALKVYPSVAAIREGEAAKGAMSSVKFYRKLLLGTTAYGPDIYAIREHQEGDEDRFIDWKATARLDKVIVKEFIKEAPAPLRILLDCTTSMRQRIRKSKTDYSSTLALQVASCFLELGYPVGLMLYRDYASTEYLPPRLGGQQKKKILEVLTRLPQELDAREFRWGLPELKYRKLREETDRFLSTIATFLRGSTKGKGATRKTGIFDAAGIITRTARSAETVIVITDLESHLLPLLEALRMLKTRGHRVIIISPYSPLFFLNANLSPETLEAVYKNYLTRHRNIRKLTRLGIGVIETGPSDYIRTLSKELTGKEVV